MDPPRLPWEVIERVVDLSTRRPNTLCSLSLTCRQLRPRSQLLMFARVQLESSDHAFAFVAFLQANPRLQPLIYAIIVTPSAFRPSLLYVLPNLSSIECVDERKLEEPEDEDEGGSEGEGTAEANGEDGGDQAFNLTMSHLPPGTDLYVRRSSLDVHHTSLACFRRLGSHIQTLSLNSVSFPTSLAFAQMLFGFPCIERLHCNNVTIEALGNEAPLEIITRRLSQQMQLKALSIDGLSMGQGGVRDGHTASPGELLFHSKLAPSTMEKLRLVDIDVSRLDARAHQLQPNEWCRLEYLVLHTSTLVETPKVDPNPFIEPLGTLLERFPDSPRLREVVTEYRLDSANTIVKRLHNVIDERYGRLKHALLTFSPNQPRIVVRCTIVEPTCSSSLSFWARELEKCSPYSSVTLECNEVIPAKHDGLVLDLIVSPDSKWLATGSKDSTVILWNIRDGTIAQRWVAHNYEPVWSVAFSPDGQCLLSGGDDGMATIWDLSQGVRKVATLEGHDKAGIRICTWSPNGDMIVTGSNDGATQLWDANTFRLQAFDLLEDTVACLAFSSDGLWLAYGSDRGECRIMNVMLGTLHRSLWNSGSKSRRQYRGRTIAAFDPASGSLRLATAPCGSCMGISIVDVENGVILVHLGGKRAEMMPHMHDVSFSPDGKLVLGAGAETVHIWDASTGIARFKASGRGDNSDISQKASRRGDDSDIFQKARFSPCGKYIASTAIDQTISLWRTSDWSCVATFSGHLATKAAFSPDGKTLCSGAKDGTVVIRQMRDIIPTDEQHLRRRQRRGR